MSIERTAVVRDDYARVPAGRGKEAPEVTLQDKVWLGFGIYTCAAILQRLFGPVTVELWQWLRMELRFLWWMWTAPNMVLLQLRGLDKESRDIIFNRWLARSPIPQRAATPGPRETETTDAPK